MQRVLNTLPALGRRGFLPMQGGLTGPGGQFNADNEFNISFTFTGPLTATSLSEWTRNGVVIDIPDGTRGSGGRINPFDVTVEIPMHLREENARMYAWLEAFRLKVPGYKSPGVANYPEGFFSAGGTTFLWGGCMVTGEGVDAVRTDADGKMLVTRWPISVDESVRA